MTTLINKPKIYHWMNKDEVEFLNQMHKTVSINLSKSALFKNESYKLQYFNDIGESSYIAVIQTAENKYIIKSAKDTQKILIETTILQKWDSLGIKTPKILETGTVDIFNFFIMEFIEAPLLYKAYSAKRLLEKGFIRQMGETLRKMSTLKGHGFGKLISENFVGAYTDFSQYIDISLINNTGLYPLFEKKHLDIKDRDKILRARDTIAQDIEKNKIASVVCHMDFSVYNMFATNPITVFDPGEARMNHPYIDLAQSLLIMFNLENDISDLSKEFILGYNKNSNLINERTLRACLYIQGIKKLTTWLKKKRYASAKILKNYLSTLEF